MMNRSLLAAALVTLAACGRGGGDAAETQPAGTQPAPTPQHQAAPHTEPNTPHAAGAQAPPPPTLSYDECMVRSRGSTESTRKAAERFCAALPDAPK
jgi:hypothetical protein